jgi:hypothetical protein
MTAFGNYCPQLCVPYAYDQPYFSKKNEELCVGLSCTGPEDVSFESKLNKLMKDHKFYEARIKLIWPFDETKQSPADELWTWIEDKGPTIKKTYNDLRMAECRHEHRDSQGTVSQTLIETIKTRFAEEPWVRKISDFKPINISMVGVSNYKLRCGPLYPGQSTVSLVVDPVGQVAKFKGSSKNLWDMVTVDHKSTSEGINPGIVLLASNIEIISKRHRIVTTLRQLMNTFKLYVVNDSELGMNIWATYFSDIQDDFAPEAMSLLESVEIIKPQDLRMEHGLLVTTITYNQITTRTFTPRMCKIEYDEVHDTTNYTGMPEYDAVVCSLAYTEACSEKSSSASATSNSPKISRKDQKPTVIEKTIHDMFKTIGKEPTCETGNFYTLVNEPTINYDPKVSGFCYIECIEHIIDNDKEMKAILHTIKKIVGCGPTEDDTTLWKVLAMMGMSYMVWFVESKEVAYNVELDWEGNPVQPQLLMAIINQPKSKIKHCVIYNYEANVWAELKAHVMSKPTSNMDISYTNMTTYCQTHDSYKLNWNSPKTSECYCTDLHLGDEMELFKNYKSLISHTPAMTGEEFRIQELCLSTNQDYKDVVQKLAFKQEGHVLSKKRKIGYSRVHKMSDVCSMYTSTNLTEPTLIRFNTLEGWMTGIALPLSATTYVWHDVLPRESETGVWYVSRVSLVNKNKVSVIQPSQFTLSTALNEETWKYINTKDPAAAIGCGVRQSRNTTLVWDYENRTHHRGGEVEWFNNNQKNLRWLGEQ